MLANIAKLVLMVAVSGLRRKRKATRAHHCKVVYFVDYSCLCLRSKLVWVSILRQLTSHLAAFEHSAHALETCAFLQYEVQCAEAQG